MNSIQENPVQNQSASSLSLFSLKKRDENMFDVPCTILNIGKSNGKKKDGTAVSDKAADLLITISFGKDGYKSFGAYSSSIFPNGIPKMPLGGLSGIATFKKQEGYEPSLRGFKWDEEVQEARIRAAVSQRLGSALVEVD